MMGIYVVRFKGFPIKGTSKDQPVDDEEEVVDVEGSEKKPKKKGKEPFAPEKAVVENVFGVKDVKPAKKEMIILDEKGSAKSGNYGHAGRAGKLGGSAPKGARAGFAGDVPASDANAAKRANTSAGKVGAVGSVKHGAPTGKYAAKPVAKAPVGVATPVKQAAPAADRSFKPGEIPSGYKPLPDVPDTVMKTFKGRSGTMVDGHKVFVSKSVTDSGEAAFGWQIFTNGGNHLSDSSKSHASADAAAKEAYRTWADKYSRR
jgi:hypothetical protein